MSNFFGGVSRRLTDITSSSASSKPKNGSERNSTRVSTKTSSKTSGNYAAPKDTRRRPPSDAEKLMMRLGVPEKEAYWFERVHDAVRRYMDSRSTSTSFNFTHIERVVENVRQLWNLEKQHSWAKNLDPLTIFVGAMAYDIGNDDTYTMQVVRDGGSARTLEADDARRQRQVDVVFDFLRTNKCPPAVAGPASHFAALVSFPREMNDQKGIRGQCEAYPALMLVQDAVRLDDLGATGIQRAHRLHKGGAPSEATVVKLIDERFAFYVGLMKTKSGKKEAEKLWADMLRYKNGLWDGKRGCWVFL